MLLAFSRDYLRGEGDVTRHLSHFGYTVTHVQTMLDEYDYAVSNLAVDLRDGLKLTSVAATAVFRELRTDAAFVCFIYSSCLRSCVLRGRMKMNGHYSAEWFY